MEKIESTINNFRRKLNSNVQKGIISTFGDRGNEEKTIKYYCKGEKL